MLGQFLAWTAPAVGLQGVLEGFRKGLDCTLGLQEV